MLSKRASKAIALVGSDSVKHRGNDRYSVLSWDTPSRSYEVRPGYCNCPDFAYRGYEPCAHLLAVGMYQGITAVTSPLFR